MAIIHEVQFPRKVAYGSKGGPGWRTIMQEGDSGFRETIGTWQNARRKYNVKYGIRSIEDLIEVYNFVIGRNGPEFGFRYPDPLDFTSASNHRSPPTFSDQLLGTYDGSTMVFPLKKLYTSGPTTRTRVITKPVAGTVVVGVNGSQSANFIVDTVTGLVTLTVAPSNGHQITAGFEFDVPAQFGMEVDDDFQIVIDSFDAASIPDIPIYEIVGDNNVPEQPYAGGSSVITVASGGVYPITTAARFYLILGPSSTSAELVMPNPANFELGPEGMWIFSAVASGSIAIKNHTRVSTITTLTGVQSAMMTVYQIGGTKFGGAVKNA